MPALLEIAPGQVHRPPAPATPLAAEPKPPAFVFMELIPLGAGTYRLRPRALHDWVGVRKDSLRQLGIEVSSQTIRRLGRAGFVRIRQISPQVYEFSFASWLEHCARVEADPEEFWDRPDPRHHGRTPRQIYGQSI